MSVQPQRQVSFRQYAVAGIVLALFVGAVGKVNPALGAWLAGLSLLGIMLYNPAPIVEVISYGSLMLQGKAPPIQWSPVH